MSELNEVVKEFLVESYENLDQLDRDLVTLEKDPGNRDGITSIFRTVHTIKGTCGFFDFVKLGAVAHAGENLLGQLRDGRLTLNPEITTDLLALVDALRALLANIESTGCEGGADYTALIARLARARDSSEPDKPVPAALVHGEDKSALASTETRTDSVSESSIRVDVALLDKLMTLMGELVLARNQILQLTTTQRDPLFLSTSQRLNLITTELQEGIMKARMLPIGNIWDKFPRLVRDVALACGKQVRLELEGKETELDKSIAEAIKDPLTHLVRNAIDHGIESPDVRLRLDKPAQGRLHLRAFHEGGQVNIEISDDGAGLDPERIKQKALERGLIGHEQSALLSAAEVVDLLFLPGFSTAERITSVSGRGVGMDVVKTNIERISGSIDLQSRPGQGTTIRMRIPLTLAIIPALLVSCEGDYYALPQVNLVELVREGNQVQRNVDWIHGTPFYRLRGNLLPLVYLARELQLRDVPLPAAEQALNIVILQADGRHFGLVVDGVRDTAEIVVKPLGKQLKDTPVFAGATILGDGKVALILDVPRLAQRANVLPEVRERARPESVSPAASATAGSAADDVQALVLFELGNRYRLAMPLAQVARLEEIPWAAVEKKGERKVVQYRGGIMSLVFLAQVLPGADRDTDEKDAPLQVIVLARPANGVGLVVDRVLDVIESSLQAYETTPRPGVLGTAVIERRVTDLLDVEGVLRLAHATAVKQPMAV